jgi:hypothetical protein
MKYKVEGCVVPVDGVPGVAYVVTPISRWYTAESHFDAAAMLILDNPEINCKDIHVVDEDYNLGCYPLDGVKWKADYMVGLRWEKVK